MSFRVSSARAYLPLNSGFGVVFAPLITSRNCKGPLSNLKESTPSRMEEDQMSLTQDQEHIVELLRGMASSIAAEPAQGQITLVIHSGSGDDSLPWKGSVAGSFSHRDFGVGLPPLTQKYS